MSISARKPADVRPGASFEQTTLRSPIRIAGIGMHTGEQGCVTLRPARPNAGIVFLCGATRIPARAPFVVSTRRCTRLGNEGVSVDTVEHLLSALYGLGVDNAVIEIEGPEVPILDGSALPWVEAIREAGIEALGVAGERLALGAPVVYAENGTWMVATPAERLSITCVTDFQHPLLGLQSDTFYEDPDAYAAGIAPARTFGFAAEVEALLAAGLARGGSIDNALVIYDDRFSDALRVPDECLRHKALDLWGDLSLVGGRLGAAITAIKPGHPANTALAARIGELAARRS